MKENTIDCSKPSAIRDMEMVEDPHMIEEELVHEEERLPLCGGD